MCKKLLLSVFIGIICCSCSAIVHTINEDLGILEEEEEQEIDESEGFFEETLNDIGKLLIFW